MSFLGQRATACVGVLLAAGVAATCTLGVAAPADKPAERPSEKTPEKAVEKGRAWATLSVNEQQALSPLKKDWGQIDPPRQRKWLEVASRFPAIPAEERGRIQERMAQWAAMTPAQRASARLQFQEARQLSPGERQAKWEAYQALPDEKRRELAQRARPEVKPAAAVGVVRPALAASSGAPGSAGKNNLVKAQPPALRAVSPAIVQAKPGATTTTMATRPSPPPHHQAGLPKIAATPEFVDPATLLPKRGAQAAATVETIPVVNSDPDKTP
jgi:hypothetical protein